MWTVEYVCRKYCKKALQRKSRLHFPMADTKQPSSYLGDYFAEECADVKDSYAGADAHKYFFDPTYTLFIAIAIVSLRMWLRRCLIALTLIFEGVVFNNLTAAAESLKLAIHAAAKRSPTVQAGLLLSLNRNVIGMPDIPSFGALVRAFQRRDKDHGGAVSDQVPGDEEAANKR